MTAFRDFFDLFPPLVLPIRGREYEIPSPATPDIERWQAMHRKLTAGEPLAEGELMTDAECVVAFLGDAGTQMRKDGVAPEALGHALTTAIADAVGGRMLAERVWNTADPVQAEAAKANLAKVQAETEKLAAPQAPKKPSRKRPAAKKQGA